MAFDLGNITTIGDCDSVITAANVEKNALALKKSNLSSDLAEMNPVFQASSSEFKAIDTELTGLESIHNNTTDPKTKLDYEKRMRHVQLRKLVLTERIGANSTVVQALLQLDIAQIDAQISTIDAFITAVQARKAQL